MAIRDYTFAMDPQNTLGKQQLSSDLTLQAWVPVSRNSTEKERVTLGFAQSITVDESRAVTYSYVIGNQDPSRPRDLIPSAIQNSTLRIPCLVFWKVNPVGLFSNNKPENERVAGTRLASSLSYQTKPFDVVETWTNPTTGNVVYTQTYKDCYIESCGHTADNPGNADIRVATDVLIHFKTTRMDINQNEINDPSLGNLDIK